MGSTTRRRYSLFFAVAATATIVEAFSPAPTLRQRTEVLQPYGNGRNGGLPNFQKQSHGSFSPLQSTLLAVNMEELLYNAQSAASDLASLSLQDPSNFVTSLPIMYGAGLLTSFSPCVWGLLPLTMSYISQAAGEREDQNAALPTLAFAAGLAAVFCTLGIVVASLGGAVFGGTTGNSVWLPLVSNTICFAMGLQLLGFVQVQFQAPKWARFFDSTTSSTSKSDAEPILIGAQGQILSSSSTAEQTSTNNNNQASSLFRTFLLGGSSALVASPCATPVLTSILAYVANAPNAAAGALLLLGYTLGYSTPLLLVASTGGQALVKLKALGKSNNSNTNGEATSSSSSAGFYGTIGPWVTPLTGGVLLWYGTNGLLVALFGDPSLAGLAPILE